VECAALKPFILLLSLSCPLHAELLAHLQTTKGEVIIELQYTKAPQAVANFITLSQGTRKRLDVASGVVTNRPFYIGEKFFRVVNETSFKIAQTGSGNGTNVGGGPGYTFKDEFDATLTHVPYVLSMANSGPNTNGSQIFLTGNATIPSLNNVHTIFGLVQDSASRVVVDAIHAAGNDGTTITGVTFERTDAAALAFDEMAQNLPDCTGLPGELTVTLGTESLYTLSSAQAPGSILQGFRSTNLATWQKLGQIYQGTGQAGFDNITLDNASLPKAFYNLSLVTYPDALTPGSYTNRTLTAGLFGNQTLTFHFDSTGQGGTVVYSGDSSTNTITAVTYSPTSPYAAAWIIYTNAYNPFRITARWSSDTSSMIFGTNTSEQLTSGQWQALSSGSLSLTK
jgi:cyclophilin family peptidyl-prolyl cis-trans isomerase